MLTKMNYFLASFVVCFFFVFNTNSASFSKSYWCKNSLESIYDTVSVLPGLASNIKKNGIQNGVSDTSKTESANQAFIAVKCYEGAGVDRPLPPEQMVELYILPAQKPSGYEAPPTIPTNRFNTDSSGSFNGSIVYGQGTYFILVKSPAFTPMWWDGKQLSEQPTLTTLSSSLTQTELHFSPGCSLRVLLNIQNNEAEKIEILKEIICFLVDTSGMIIAEGFRRENDINSVLFTQIPTGNYFLYADCLSYSIEGYPRVIYSSSNSVGIPASIGFSNPGDKIDSLLWNLYFDITVTKNETLSIIRKDSINIGNYIYQKFINMDLSFISSNTNSIKIPVNHKFFIGDIFDYTNKKKISICWYPGSFFRSFADTILIKPGESPSISLVNVERCRIRGKVPHFSDTRLKYDVWVSTNGQSQSLGAYTTLDSLDSFYIATPPGTYSLWAVPCTDGYVRASGWSAVGLEPVTVSIDSEAVVTLSQRQLNIRSIEGNVLCKSDPLIACFDTLGRVVSITDISLYDYYKNLNLPRSRFFSFKNIFSRPYQIPYSLNFLAPGRYALVIAEPADTLPGFHTIRWYGGPEFKTTIIEKDDLSHLQIPLNVNWVKIDSANTVVTLPTWKSALQRRQWSNVKDENIILPIQVLPRGAIFIKLPSPTSIGKLRVFGANGRLFAKYGIRGSQVVKLESACLNNLLVFELSSENRRNFIKSFVSTR